MQAFLLIFIFHQIFDLVLGGGRIYGGYPIDITQAPYMAHVQYTVEYLPNNRVLLSDCGGSILRKNLILTAGHCTKNLTTGIIHRADRYQIRVASSFIRSGGRTHSVSRVFVHPNFVGASDNFHHDVGLLQLTDNIVMDNSASYTTLAHANDPIYAGDDGVVSGWGKNLELQFKLFSN